MLVTTISFKLLRLLHEWYHYAAMTVPEMPPSTRTWRVDMLTTFCAGEPYQMVVQTLKAMQAVRYPHTTYLCDNEVHLLASSLEDQIFGTINDLSRMVHALDPQHPTTYMTNGPTGAWKAWKACEDLDIISVNVFSGIDDLKQALSWGGGVINRPILISEWAPSGYWNALSTSWGAPIEANGEEKAVSYVNHYQNYLSEASGGLLGSCLFLWGQKQEQTHSWFSVFTEQGEPTVLVDEITHMWTGTYPTNRAPLAQAIQVGDYEVTQELILYQGETYLATGYAHDFDHDSLTYAWEITREFDRGFITGGDAESRPPALQGLSQAMTGQTMRFYTPSEIGAYRIFFYVRDDHGHAGVTNVPFFVTKAPKLEKNSAFRMKHLAE
jgi:hypothetical protein